MGHIWGRKNQGGTHDGPMNFAIWVSTVFGTYGPANTAVNLPRWSPDSHHHRLIAYMSWTTSMGWRKLHLWPLQNTHRPKNEKRVNLYIYIHFHFLLFFNTEMAQAVEIFPCRRQGSFYHTYRQVSNLRRTLVGNKIVDHSDVVGASPVGAAPTTSSFST